MTEDQEPRGSEAYQDPLHISPESKADGTSYQWFRFSAEPKWPWRDPSEHGWQPVARSSMETEPSDSDEFIQRREMRLYQRPQELTDQERERDIGWSARELRIIEGLLRGEHDAGSVYGFSGGGTGRGTYVFDHADNASVYSAPERTKWNWVGVGLRRHARGRIFVIHEEKCRPCLANFVNRHWRGLARLRAVWISKDETDVMLLGNVDSATWAWCKRDLLREGAFYRRYLDISTQPRPRRPSKIKPRVVAAWRWCRKQAAKVRNLWKKTL